VSAAQVEAVNPGDALTFLWFQRKHFACMFVLVYGSLGLALKSQAFEGEDSKRCHIRRRRV